MDIEFAVGGNSEVFTRAGWYAPELNGRWTQGFESVLSLPRTPGATVYRCAISMMPFTDGGEIPFQRFSAAVGGMELLNTFVANAGRYEFEVPAALTGDGDTFQLVLRCPDALVPASRKKGGDVRHLGMMVGRMRFAPDVPERPMTVPPRGDHAALAPKPAIPIPLVVERPAAATDPRVAAVTMVYNEPVYLPIWLRHYAKQVGIENCYVIDHGSDDGSTHGLGNCNVIRIPRSPYDPKKQSAFNSGFCSSLLTWFDWVAYSDVDELLMADPKVASTLAEYCRRPLPAVVSAIGLNNIHRPEFEPELDPSRPVSEQRPYVFTAASMCKPVLIREPVRWAAGSHCCEQPIAFDHLYMFHLRWFDLPYGMRRLAKTRAMAWASAGAGAHQRSRDEEMEVIHRGFARLPPRDGVDFDPASPPVSVFLDKVLASRVGLENKEYKIDLGIWANELWRMPERFIGAF